MRFQTAKVANFAEKLAALQCQFEQASPQEVLRWAIERFGEKVVLVTSFQPTGVVTLHMLSEMKHNVPVVTLDTGLLFPETYELMEILQARLDFSLTKIQPPLSVEQQAEHYGDRLWERDPDQCCHLRKVLPLQSVLPAYDAWITGIRRDQSATRAKTPVISWDNRHQLIKLCPFATWTEEMVWTYIRAHKLPYNKLHDLGYPSIGCLTCTQAVSQGDDMRAGRWANHVKTECGIHIAPKES